IGRFDAQGVPESYVSEHGEQKLALMIDPLVIKAFGGGKLESSIESLSRELCMQVALGCTTTKPAKEVVTELNRTIKRLKGALQRSASVDNVAKRVIRGASAVNARSRCGYVPPSWTAVSW